MVTAVKMNNRMAKKDTIAEKSPDGKPSKAPRDPLADHPHLKTTIAQIEKQFGEGSIMPLGATEGATTKVQGIPTGSFRWTWLWAASDYPKGASSRFSALNRA